MRRHGIWRSAGHSSRRGAWGEVSIDGFQEPLGRDAGRFFVASDRFVSHFSAGVVGELEQRTISATPGGRLPLFGDYPAINAISANRKIAKNAEKTSIFEKGEVGRIQL